MRKPLSSAFFTITAVLSSFIHVEPPVPMLQGRDSNSRPLAAQAWQRGGGLEEASPPLTVLHLTVRSERHVERLVAQLGHVERAREDVEAVRL